jgi:hypothetical protein
VDAASFHGAFQTQIERLHPAHVLAGSFGLGLAAALVLRPSPLPGAMCAAAILAIGVVSERYRVGTLAAALAVAGLTWGAVRLDEADSSELVHRIGESAQAVMEVTSPVRTGSTHVRMFVRVRTFAGHDVNEMAQLEAPLAVVRPRRGDVLSAIARVVAPEGPRDTTVGRSFDESAYLARSGVQVVLEAPWLSVTGSRGGVAGASDRVRRFLAAGMGEGMNASQRALVRGVVLGEDEALDDELLDRSRRSRDRRDLGRA